MKSIWLVAVVCSGCFVVPGTQTTRRHAGTEHGRIQYGRIQDVTLEPGASRTHISVKATARRDCHREILAVTEVTKTKHVRMGGADDPRARAFGFLLAPVTIPVSLLITGLVVAADDGETSRELAPLRTETYPCTTEAADVALETKFPSGAVLRGNTDATGQLRVQIPEGEPYSGQVQVSTGGAVAQVHYEQPVPPVTVARGAIETCRSLHQIAGVTLKLTINERGLATNVWGSAGDGKFSACVASRISGVIFPRALHGSTLILPFEAPAS